MSSGESTSDPTTRARAFGRDLLQRVTAISDKMSRPWKVFAISTVVACVAVFGFLGYRSTETSWTVLFSNLDRDDAAAVMAKLKEMKVPYRVEGDGNVIEVPQQSARELRLELAGSGLPRGGGVGFESFDKMRVGATEFEQRVLYRRSLEGELARTIDTIASVQSARVHLVLPERSVFVGKHESASASVVLKLRGSRALGGAEVSGIVHLVSSSVSGLPPERVTVVTTDGTMLHRGRRAGEGGAAGGFDEEEQAQTARTLENTLEERARAMLEKVVGAGHVDVRVTAEIDRARVERTEDRYDPKNGVVRSEQRSVERTSTETSATGVPGAESNLPGGAGRGDAGVDGLTRESTTRNFEVDHIVEKRLIAGGALRRLTVAVVVDGAGTPRSKEDVDRLAALVRSAVGADPQRGDLVTVEAVPFVVAAAPEVPTTPPPFAIPKQVRTYGPWVAGGAVVMVALLATAIVRRRRAKMGAEAAAAAAERPIITPVLEPSEPTLVLGSEELRETAQRRAEADPATAAMVLRFWLAAGDPPNVATPE